MERAAPEESHGTGSGGVVEGRARAAGDVDGLQDFPQNATAQEAAHIHTSESSTPPEDMISAELEQTLDDIDSGKIKLTRYDSLEEYLKHVDEVVNE